MTTPRDAIAGLSERLRKRSEPSEYSTGDVLGEEAATQLDSLLKERDEIQQVFDSRWEADQRAIKAWQAAHSDRPNTWPDHADMVVWLLKERDALQARVKELEARPPLLDAKSIPRVDALVKTLEARATRLQQERDEAYERAVSVALAHISEPGLSDNPTYIRFEPSNMMARKIAAAIRRLAGPEKEQS